jgi:CheY-like chemotaxis protein
MLSQILGGKLNIVYSKPNIGTCIEFSLILDEVDTYMADSNKSDHTEVLDLENYNVLIVEDEQINRIVLDKILRQLGYKNIDTANNGEDAIKMFNVNHYDILLIDIRMPFMTGFELADKIYDICIKLNKSVPAMLGITAQLLMDNDTKPWFKHFIYKPIDMHELDVKMKQLLKN